jgi:hypothetical protein
MLSITLVLLMKWFYTPERRGCPYVAFLFCGLTFSSHQLLFATAFGLQVIVMCADANLRRDLCFANTLLFFAGLIANGLGCLPVLDSHPPQLNLLWLAFFSVGIGSIGMCILQTVRTLRFLTEWKAVLVMAAMFLLGLTSHVYLPIASMTTPPANWGYPRTVEGFWHAVTRG